MKNILFLVTLDLFLLAGAQGKFLQNNNISLAGEIEANSEQELSIFEESGEPGEDLDLNETSVSFRSGLFQMMGSNGFQNQGGKGFGFERLLSPGFFCASLGIRVGIDNIICKTQKTLLFCADYKCKCGYGVFYPIGIHQPLYTVWDPIRRKCVALKGSICGSGSGGGPRPIECVDNLACLTNPEDIEDAIGPGGGGGVGIIHGGNLRHLLGGFGVCSGSLVGPTFILLLLFPLLINCILK